MIVIGLTGSIGMGKSTTAGYFAKRGVPVLSSDAEVHRLYRGEAVAPIEAAFPGTTTRDGVDRKRLAERVLGDDAAIRRLEAIVHPLVRERTRAFLRRALAAGARSALVDIPLLFETGAERDFDLLVVATAPPSVQRERVLARPDMTAERFEAVLENQMPDAEKRRRCHFIVDTSLGFEATERQVEAIIRAVAGLTGTRTDRLLRGDSAS